MSDKQIVQTVTWNLNTQMPNICIEITKINFAGQGHGQVTQQQYGGQRQAAAGYQPRQQDEYVARAGPDFHLQEARGKPVI